MKIYNIRVVPFVKYVEKKNSDGIHYESVDNLTADEINNMSAKPVIYWEFGEEAWLAESPLYINITGGFKDKIFYVYDDLNDEEKEIFKDRTINIALTKEKVVKVYKSKRKVRK